MFGAAFVCLQQYMQDRLGYAKWKTLLAKAGLPVSKVYSSICYYSDAEFDLMWKLSAAELEMDEQELLRRLGQAVGQYILLTYSVMFQKSWKSLDVIEKAASKIYKIIQLIDPYTPESSLTCQRIASNEVVLQYQSPRKFCNYVVGIIEAISIHFNETLEVSQPKCLHSGDSACEIHARLIDRDSFT